MSKFSHLPYRENVGIMLINKECKIFVGQRIDNKAWQMPQGGIDEGEDPKLAAIREMFEETGVDEQHVKLISEMDEWVSYDLPDELIHTLWNGTYRGQRQKWFLFQLLGGEEHININTDHPEFSAWKWIDADELLNTIVPFKKDVYKAALTHFKPIINSQDL